LSSCARSCVRRRGGVAIDEAHGSTDLHCEILVTLAFLLRYKTKITAAGLTQVIAFG
jgi:hypothetical protein